MPSRASYDNKFKLNAIKLANELGSNREAADRLGINEANIRGWKKQVDAISEAPRTKCITKNRVSAKFPDIDERVSAFIDEKRKNGLGVSRNLIRLEALRVARQLGIPDTEFKASPGWCTRFMNRNGDKHYNGFSSK